MVIDTNTLGYVLNEDDKLHEYYKPVYDFLFSHNGYMVLGGTHYLKENSNRHFRTLITALQRKNKIVFVCHEAVDKIEEYFLNKGFRLDNRTAPELLQ